MNEIVLELKSAAEWFAQHGRTEYSAIIGICNRAVEEINRQKAEIERLTTQLEQKDEMLANTGIKLISYEEENEKLKTDLQAMRSAANSLKMHLWKYQDIESTIDEFWTGLEKLSMYKGKDKPTLEELLEYIEQVKDEAVKEKQVEIIKDLALRIKMRLEAKAVLYSLSERDCEFAINQATALKAVDEVVAELTPTLNKLPHNSLCETETYEGK
jgi:chromosome segregation ATPase